MDPSIPLDSILNEPLNNCPDKESDINKLMLEIDYLKKTIGYRNKSSLRCRKCHICFTQ